MGTNFINPRAKKAMFGKKKILVWSMVILLAEMKQNEESEEKKYRKKMLIKKRTNPKSIGKKVTWNIKF